MLELPARIQRLRLPPGKRLLVISDIHGNLPYFDALLAKAKFSLADELILDGDFLEKGPDSLGTLRRILALSEGGNVHAVCGNCDRWYEIFHPAWTAEDDKHTLSYLRWRQSGLIWEMCREAGLDPLGLESLDPVRALRGRYEREWAFLESLPHAIETERFLFAHAGADPDKPLEEHSAGELIHIDAFLRSGRRFAKWVIVGHWPVMLYGENTVCANPIIDREARIVSIDGGCVLKDDGQLNALVIPDRDSEDFDFIAYDPFPVRTAAEDQPAGERSYYIRWGDNKVRVLRRGAEFSLCRHIRTGYEMWILTKYLYTDEDLTTCNDCTDYLLPLRAGDLVSVIEQTSQGALVKHRGVSGWYRGRLL